MMRTQPDQILFAAGDYLVGGLVGAATAAAVRAVVSRDLDMVLAMLIGTAVGMAVHLAIGLAVAPFLGLFHCMVPSGLIGMYGGMLFAMRDAMQHHRGSLEQSVLVGLIFGAVVADSALNGRHGRVCSINVAAVLILGGNK
jgi:hypothetical protein